LVLRLLLLALLWLSVLILLLAALLLLVLVLLRRPFLVLLLLAWLIFGSDLLLGLGLFFVLLILLSVSRSNGSDNAEQNCRTDDSKSFHEFCLTFQPSWGRGD
jgi:hypothetical protein